MTKHSERGRALIKRGESLTCEPSDGLVIHRLLTLYRDRYAEVGRWIISRGEDDARAVEQTINAFTDDPDAFIEMLDVVNEWAISDDLDVESYDCQNKHKNEYEYEYQ